MARPARMAGARASPRKAERSLRSVAARRATELTPVLAAVWAGAFPAAGGAQRSVAKRSGTNGRRRDWRDGQRAVRDTA